MGEVDPSFIQAIEHRPKLTITEAQGIPIISLSQQNDQENLITNIRDACKNWGFFQVIDHGVDLELLEKMKLKSKEFFKQSKEEKLKISRDETNPVGYYDTEHTKNVRDWKEVFDFTVETPMLLPKSLDPNDLELMEVFNQWPQYPPDLRCKCVM